MKSAKCVKLLICLTAVIAVTLVSSVQARGRRGDPASESQDKNHPIPATVAEARRGDMDIVITALGTVIARDTVTIRSRVDGELMRVNFREGQGVKAGDLLAEIDPRPFQIALQMADGQLRHDQALLENSRSDLSRYRDLLAQDSIAMQQVDAQGALVRQYEGTVIADRAQVENAKLQLVYARITAPITGRLGLRQLDVGNVIRASDSQGLVIITSIQPITCVFSIPSEKLPSIQDQLKAGATLRVDAFDRSGSTRLAVGRLTSLDNQIDIATGTLKLKAEFDNRDEKLFPNQFVNIGLHVETRRNVTLIPTAAVQQGQAGAFVYAVDAEQTVNLRKVRLGPVTEDSVVVEEGVEAGDRVVIDGVDKLHDGVKVEPTSAASVTSGAPPSSGSASIQVGSQDHP